MFKDNERREEFLKIIRDGMEKGGDRLQMVKRLMDFVSPKEELRKAFTGVVEEFRKDIIKATDAVDVGRRALQYLEKNDKGLLKDIRATLELQYKGDEQKKLLKQNEQFLLAQAVLKHIAGGGKGTDGKVMLSAFIEVQGKDSEGKDLSLNQRLCKLQ